MNLATRYMGLPLANPFVASSSPLSGSLDTIRQLEDNGAAAVVLFSLFEERISHAGATGPCPALDSVQETTSSPARYLELIRRSTEAVAIPVIASLNGVSDHGWIAFARDMQAAGASAIELNVYYIPTDPGRTGAQVEQQYVDVLTEVKAAVSIPVAMKLGPYFSAFAHMATRLDAAGADALVLFNRFYQPDFDIENRVIVPSLQLSRPEEIGVPLLWIALLHGHVHASLAATTGVHTPVEALKYLMAGADVVMTTSALLHHGPAFLSRLVTDVGGWMAKRGYASVDQLRGSMSHRAIPDADAFVRSNYIRTLEGYRETDA